jgi:tRNA (adenine22-N1)-methyltransferase
MTVNLDSRLNAVADCVRQGVRVADIGCDHAMLLCALANQNRITAGIASEINERPLEAARRNALRLSFSNLISFRLGDGLRTIKPDEVEDIVIAGMGGETIAKILADCPWRFLPNMRLILQPMTRSYTLRKFLYENGFSILSEKVCISDKRLYTVMHVHYSAVFQPLDDYDPACFIGSLNIETDFLAKEMIKHTISFLTKKREGSSLSNADNAEKITFLIETLKHKTKG